MKLKTLLTATSFLCTSLLGGLPSAARADVPLFIFAGQSNMVGYGTNSDELVGPLAPYAGAQSKVKFWGPTSSATSPSWGDLKAPTELVGVLPPYKGFGPEVSAGKDIADTLGYTRVAIVKHSVGATGLAPSAFALDWAPASYELSKQLLDRYTAASAAMPGALGEAGRPSAFFWMQGETDGSNAIDAANYQSRLQEFIYQVRVGYAQSTLPFIIGQVNSSPYASSWKTVQTAQVAVVRADPRAAFVLTDDLPRLADDLHYTSAGIVELGRRFAHAYQQFVPGAGGPGVLANPGFEAQRISTFVGIPGNYNGGSTVSGALQGWTDLASGVTLVRSESWGPGTGMASEGKQWLSLKNGYFNGGNGSVVQTFPTVPGRVYTVSFDYAALSAGNSASSSFWVGIDGVNKGTFTVSTAGTTVFRMTPWQTYTFIFVATGSATTLGFASLDPADASFFGAGIDNVRVY